MCDTCQMVISKSMTPGELGGMLSNLKAAKDKLCCPEIDGPLLTKTIELLASFHEATRTRGIACNGTMTLVLKKDF